MRAFIYVGGSVNADMITEHPKGDDIVLCADSGYENAKKLGERADIFVGDMDSYTGELDEKLQVVRLKPEKDVTDTQAAFELAVEKGADDIIIIGGLSGRLDHTMANLSVLEDANARRIHCLITDGNNRVRFIRDDSTLLGRSQFKYFGLIAADETVKGVEIKGAKYCVERAKLSRRTGGFSVSNEIDGNCAFIAVKKGGVFIIESN